MKPIDKKIDEDIEEGNIPEPIEDLSSEYLKEDRDLEGRGTTGKLLLRVG